MGTEFYLIKDIAALSNFSVYTIKYYLKLGLIQESGRSASTNFRYFNESVLDALKKIREYRKNGVSLNKIKELITAKGCDELL